MKKYFMFFLYIFFLLSYFELVSSEGDTIRYSGNVKNLINAGDKIVVSGRVEKFLIKLGGSAEISSEIGKDVVALFSDLEIKSNARIYGDLIVIGGKLKIDENAVIDGSTHFFNFSIKGINASFSFISFDKGTYTIIKIILILISIILALFIFALVPEKISLASDILEQNKFKSLKIGIVSILLLTFIFIIFVILSFFFIGIPMLILELLILLVLIFFGRVIIYFYLGRKIVAKFKKDYFSPGIFILTGALSYFLIDLIPYAGYFILKLLVLFEIGISIGFIFRNRLNLKSS